MGRRKKEHEKEPNLERWLVSYADFITLLFAVFVTLYAMSQVDRQKADEVIQSLQEAFHVSVLPGSGGQKRQAPLSGGMLLPEVAAGGSSSWAGMEQLLEVKARLEQEAAAADQGERMRLRVDPRGLVITLQATDLFASGSAELNPAALPLLDQVAKALAPLGNPVRIEGFTDNAAIHSAQFPSNWELSSGRALTLLHLFLERHGFAPGRLSATGYGEQHPLADNGSEEGRRHNRRVELVVPAAAGAKVDF